MEQVASAIAELQAQVGNLTNTVANLETMRIQLSEIDLPGLTVHVRELLHMRDQLGTDLPGLVDAVRNIHTAQARQRDNDRFGTGDERTKKPVNEQKEKCSHFLNSVGRKVGQHSETGCG